MDSVPGWFTGVKVNFAENLLFSRRLGDTTGKEDTKVAITEIREGGLNEAVHLTWGKLRSRTGLLIQAMKASGVVRVE
jgi:acetoacetyl-CoA synthetase